MKNGQASVMMDGVVKRQRLYAMKLDFQQLVRHHQDVFDNMFIFLCYVILGAIAISGGYFGQTGGPIVKGNFQCTGNEANLADCTNSTSTCSQHKSAGVVCPESCSEDGAIRLIGGDEMSGHVEVCTGGSWSAICDFNWCEESAKVVCGQIGYSTNREFPKKFPKESYENIFSVFERCRSIWCFLFWTRCSSHSIY